MSIIQSDWTVNRQDTSKKISTIYSPELLAANARLQQLRNSLSSVRVQTPSEKASAQTESTPASAPSLWIEPLLQRLSAAESSHAPSESSPTPSEPSPTPSEPSLYIKLHASIGLAILQEGCSAEGRIWYLCHYLDQDRRGWLDIETLREQLTTKGNPLHTCGWRQLRKLIQRGIGRFWTRDAEDRLWLKGTAHVAALLNLEKVRGQALKLPFEVFTNIQTFRAHCYACFFHLRRRDNPISRITLTSITGVHERTQIIYERIAGIDSMRCIALGNPYTVEERQNQAWKRQNKTFIFVDYQGHQGKAGEKYVAWHLPNRYQCNIETAGFGRKRRINQQLRDKQILVNHQGRGNQFDAMRQTVKTTSIFYQDGSQAVKAVRHAKADEIYWEGQQTATCILWNPIGVP